MIKKAFTLQEVLITLGIMGIIAMMTIPMMAKMKPDETKMKYIKVYNALTNITNDLLDDPAIYYTTYDDNGNVTCSGLACEGKPLVSPYNANENYIGKSKYPMLVASKLTLQDNPLTLSDTQDQCVIYFRTVDGIHWTFTFKHVAKASAPGGFVANTALTVNVNPNAAHNAVFSANNQSPNLFGFAINNDGNVTPTDALGQAYLKNPTKLNDRNQDIEEANKILKNREQN